MSEHERHGRPTDEMLVAFMDGELNADESMRVESWIARDPVTAERFDFLTRSSLPFTEAFAPLLESAPKELDAMLASLPSPASPAASASRLSRRGFLGTAAACLIAGIAIDRTSVFVERQLKKTPEDEHWRAVVAEYLELYTPDTLSSLATDRATQVAQLNTVGEKMGMALTPETIALADADFRRAQLLQYDGQPLAQLAYLDPQAGPVALCFIPSDHGPASPQMERRKDMNVVYWSSSRHAFMLIGYAPFDRLEAAADDVRVRLPA